MTQLRILFIIVHQTVLIVKCNSSSRANTYTDNNALFVQYSQRVFIWKFTLTLLDTYCIFSFQSFGSFLIPQRFLHLCIISSLQIVIENSFLKWTGCRIGNIGIFCAVEIVFAFSDDWTYNNCYLFEAPGHLGYVCPLYQVIFIKQTLLTNSILFHLIYQSADLTKGKLHLCIICFFSIFTLHLTKSAEPPIMSSQNSFSTELKARLCINLQVFLGDKIYFTENLTWIKLSRLQSNLQN